MSEIDSDQEDTEQQSTEQQTNDDATIEEIYTMALIGDIVRSFNVDDNEDENEDEDFVEEEEEDEEDDDSYPLENLRKKSPLYYYTHNCIVCQKSFDSIKKLKCHIDKENHQITRKIEELQSFIKMEEPKYIIPKQINGADTDDFNDSITKELAIDPIILPCGHLIGKYSLETYIKSSSSNNRCPTCQSKFSRSQQFAVCKVFSKYMSLLFGEELENIRKHIQWMEAQELFNRFKKYVNYKKKETELLINRLEKNKNKIINMEKLF